MRKLITWGLLALFVTTTSALQARDNDSNHGHRHGGSHSHSGRHSHGSTNPTPGRTYNNPEYYAFDWLYNPYFKNPYSYYPSYGWGYYPWYGYSYMPNRYDYRVSLSIGIGYQNSWYPGFVWH